MELEVGKTNWKLIFQIGNFQAVLNIRRAKYIKINYVLHI